MGVYGLGSVIRKLLKQTKDVLQKEIEFCRLDDRGGQCFHGSAEKGRVRECTTSWDRG